MISIIICSANQHLLKAVQENIALTIGVDFEIIAIDNRDSHSGICEVYNRGLARAKYDLLCFMHEDVIMQTQNWGIIVERLLKNTGIGLVGVAGSYYKSMIPSSWNGATRKTECVYIMQGNKAKSQDDIRFYNINPYGQNLAEVASIDGVWFCTTKTIAAKYLFDEHTFKGFHCYDLDFSLAVGQDYKVVVTYEILLTHLSEGSFNRTWMIETLKLHEKWKHHLPVLRGKLTKQEVFYIEKYTFRHFLMQIVELNFPFLVVSRWLYQLVYLKKLPIKLWLNLNFHLYKAWKQSLHNTEYKPVDIEDDFK
jgi:hypothetical protein